MAYQNLVYYVKNIMSTSKCDMFVILCSHICICSPIVHLYLYHYNINIPFSSLAFCDQHLMDLAFC